MINNTTIVIPSYNASKTIAQEIEKILKHLPESKIIVVDDNSPDKTAEVIKKHFPHDKRVKLIIRKIKAGRGSAVLAGFKKGLADKNIDFFVEMDADLCHDPKYIHQMIANCRKYDITIASKYLKESEIIGLSKGRILFSKIVNFYIKLMLKIPITDYTNGFRCYSRKALESFDFNSVSSKGFIALSEIAYKMYKNGYTFGEIPFTFNYNSSNKSNFNLSEVKEAFITILKLKFNLK